MEKQGRDFNGIGLQELSKKLGKSYKQTAKIVSRAEDVYGKPFARDGSRVIVPFSVAERLTRSTALVTRETPGSQGAALEAVNATDARRDLLASPISLHLVIEEFRGALSALETLLASKPPQRNDLELASELLRRVQYAVAELSLRPDHLASHLDEADGPTPIEDYRVLLHACRELAAACAEITRIGATLDVFVADWAARNDRSFRNYQDFHTRWQGRLTDMGKPMRGSGLGQNTPQVTETAPLEAEEEPPQVQQNDLPVHLIEGFEGDSDPPRLALPPSTLTPDIADSELTQDHVDQPSPTRRAAEAGAVQVAHANSGSDEDNEGLPY